MWSPPGRRGAPRRRRSTRRGSSSLARLVILDESGFDTRLARTHARAPRSRRALGKVSGGHWERLTLIGALALDGLCAAMTVPGAISAAVFRAFVAEVLVPALRRRHPRAAVVMDNLAAHKAAVVRAMLDRAKVGYRYLPAYSPDMNPIEQAWSKLKAHLRAKASRSRDALERAILAVLRTIAPSDARGWFRHAGYQPN